MAVLLEPFSYGYMFNAMWVSALVGDPASPIYGKAYKAGRAISTAFAESIVNSILDKRFSKSQQAQWTPRGAHLLLQVRHESSLGNAHTFSVQIITVPRSAELSRRQTAADSTLH